MKRTWLLGLLLLAGCGAVQTEEVRSPFGKHSMVGSSIRDLIHTVGTPAKYTKISDPRGMAFDTLEAEWDFSNADTALSVTVPLLVSIQIGGAGKCTMMATVSRMGGEIMDIAFPQKHVDGWTVDSSACGPLVAEFIEHPSRTELPASFDAFTLAGDSANKNTDAVIATKR
jgi:hypothetical protein